MLSENGSEITNSIMADAIDSPAVPAPSIPSSTLKIVLTIEGIGAPEHAESLANAVKSAARVLAPLITK